MVIGVNITRDVKKATWFLTKLERRQIPFATSLALNATAQAVQKVEQSTIKRDLENPTPATIKGIRRQRSTKRALWAAVFYLAAR